METLPSLLSLGSQGCVRYHNINFNAVKLGQKSREIITERG
jgi:hypothetical protein